VDNPHELANSQSQSPSTKEPQTHQPAHLPRQEDKQMTEPRCDRHVGSPYAVRCYACESLAKEYDELGIETESYLEGYDRGRADQVAATGAAMQTTLKRILTVATDPANPKFEAIIQELIDEQNEQLINAWAWGNESEFDDPNPFAVKAADSTP